jgi:hypothetical protein
LAIDSASPPCSPQMPAFLDGDLDQRGDAVIERLERIRRQNLLLDVFREETGFGGIAAVAERHLREVVRAEAEEVGFPCNLIGR